MGRYLNPGNAMFQRSLDSEIYVDKSGLIACTNRVLGGRECCVCVSRPRRFGKSMAADMLVAYYGRGCDSRGQFETLAAASIPDFERHLNAYDVIHLNVQDFLAVCGDVLAMIDEIDAAVVADLRQATPVSLGAMRIAPPALRTPSATSSLSRACRSCLSSTSGTARFARMV